MRRRTLVAAVGSGAIALSGCLFDDSGGDTGTETNDSGGDSETETGDSDGDTEPSNETGQSDGEDPPEGSTDRRYEECPREVIPYEQSPAEIQAEIDAALEGRYEDDRVFLREAMDTEASYVSVDERYYDPGVTEDGDEEVLTLELVEPKALPEARPVNVEHALDGERTIALDVVAEDERFAGDAVFHGSSQFAVRNWRFSSPPLRGRAWRWGKPLGACGDCSSAGRWYGTGLAGVGGPDPGRVIPTKGG